MAADWLPFMLVERVAFIYHFLPALLHALLLLGIVVDVGVPNVPLIAHRRSPPNRPPPPPSPLPVPSHS